MPVSVRSRQKLAGGTSPIKLSNVSGDLAITSGILRATNTPALDIVGPIALAVNLTAVHANGGSKGMIISNTSGTFQVTGTGTTAGSGGTIQNITQRGIELLSATNVTLKNMNLTNANTTDGTEPANEDNSAANAALHAFNVNGLTMDGIVISGTVSQEGVNLRNSSNFNFKNGVIGPSGQGSQEGCIYATNTGGTNTITNSTFTGPGGRVVYFSNRDTDMTLLTVDNSTFQDSKNSGLQFFGYGTSNMKLKVQNNSKFLRNPTVGVYVGANNTAVMQADIKNSSVDVGNGFGRVFDLAAAGSSTLKFNITNNTGNFNGGIGLNMFAYENGYLEGNVVGNTLTNKPASSGVSAIAIDTQGATGRGTFRIENNTILNCIDSPGIAALTTSSTGQQTNIHLIGNSVQVFGTLDNIFNGINLATTSATGNNSKLCIEVLRNAVSVPAPRLALRTRSNYATTQVLIQGPGPGVVDAWNAGSNTPTGSVLQSGQAFPYLFNQTCAPTNVSALREGIVEESSSERTIVLEAPAQEPFQAAEIAATSAEPVIEEAPETVTAAPGSARTEAVLAGETVTVNGTGAGFTIPAGRSTTIKFKATINTTIPTAVCQVTTQGTVSGSNFSSVPTDGPGGSSTNSTVTTVTSVPIITFCPGNITVNLDAGTCTATRTFAATADACPAATITYKVAGNPITFPYIFPAGATTVTVTASNGIGTAPTCTFTVTVTPIPAPVVTRNPVVQNICAGGSASFTVAGTGTINTYQWQKKPFGGSFANISSASNATAATATLSLTNLPVTDDKSQYQCIASNPCASSTSQAATLNVKQITASSIAGTVSVNQASPNPTITFGGTGGTLPYTFSYKINNGTTQTLSTTGVATTASLTQSTGIVGLFSYELVLVTDALGCTLTPATAQKADVTVVNNLTASISAGTSVCVGATSAQVTFTAVNGIAPFTFSYKLNGGPTIPLDAAGLTSTATVTVPTTASGTFSYALVSVSGAGGGGSQPAGQTASVVVNEVPTIVLSGAQYECNSALDGYTVFFKATTGSTVTSDKGTVTGNTVSGIPSGQSAILTVTKNGCSSTLPVSRNCALPVTLVNFSVSKQENVVILNWKTTAETNSEKFDIERSADAKNWQTIGVKSSGGESSSDLYYSFTDNEPTLGDNFYRLKMVDKDQTFSYSKIAFVSMNGNAKLQVYPNPVSDVLFLKTNEWAKIKSIELYNLRGTMVYKSGNNIAKTINVRDLPVGIYIISVFRKDGKITNQKVLIER